MERDLSNHAPVSIKEKGSRMSTPSATNSARSFSPAAIVLAWLFVCLLTWTQSSPAQVDRGSISGTVTDPTGSALRGAKVNIRNIGTSQEVTVVTDDQGNYSARLLIGGTYSIRIALSGFRSVVKEGVEVHVNQVSTENFTLQVDQSLNK